MAVAQILFFREHLRQAISPDFAKKYRLEASTPAWEVIKGALEQPFAQQQWDDFFSLTPWLAQNKNYLNDQVTRFRATGKLRNTWWTDEFRALQHA